MNPCQNCNYFQNLTVNYADQSFQHDYKNIHSCIVVLLIVEI